MCVFTTIFSNFNGFQILVSNVTNAKFMNGSSNSYKGSWTCKVIKSRNPSGPWTSSWTFAKSTTIVYWLKLDIIFFLVFCQNYQIGQQSFEDPLLGHWARLILNAQPEV